MGNRVIKESIKSSDEIDKLTWFEFACFVRLIVTVDDYGRYHADPIMLRNYLFPKREDVTKKAIEDAITKMDRIGLIQVYEADGHRYLQFTKWAKHQTVRNQRSKFPGPDDDCKQLNAIECNCVSNPIQSSSESESRSESSLSARVAAAWTKYWPKMTMTIETMLGDQVIKYGEKRVIEAIKKTAEADPHKPIAYLNSVLEHGTISRHTGNPAQNFSQREYHDETDEIIRRTMELDEDDDDDMDRFMKEDCGA